jgi:hypothetical protein
MRPAQQLRAPMTTAAAVALLLLFAALPATARELQGPLDPAGPTANAGPISPAVLALSNPIAAASSPTTKVYIGPNSMPQRGPLTPSELAAAAAAFKASKLPQAFQPASASSAAAAAPEGVATQAAKPRRVPGPPRLDPAGAGVGPAGFYRWARMGLGGVVRVGGSGWVGQGNQAQNIAWAPKA